MRQAVSEGDAFRLLFANNPLPMWVYDAETLGFLEVNDAAVVQYGYARDEFLAMRITDIRPPEDVTKLQEYLAMGRPPLRHAGLWRHRQKDGRLIEVEIHSHELEFRGRRAVLVAVHDRTEQYRLEQQLIQAQKMDAVGRLAGGIAHDFNNILTAILGYTELLLDSPLLAASLRPDAIEIQSAAASASALTRQLLAFGRRQIIDPVALDINTVLRRIERMLQRLIGEDVQVRLRLDPALKPARLDPVQLEQIVMNLSVNARDAMPNGGTLTIETATVTLDADYARQHLAVTPGEYVMLAVSDTGVGMDTDVLQHVFEPFFTTKPVGAGTGLGLATVYGIVKQNQGNVWVYSELGKGTTFKIYFPALQAAAEVSVARPSGGPFGTETILLVEDDPRVRALAERGLAHYGYRVLVASNGEQALNVAKSHAGDIHVLVTDVVMPGMSGKALALEMSRLRPETVVLYCSGYTANAIAHHGVLDPGITFLEKPYTPERLGRKVRDVLDARGASSGALDGV